MQIFVIQIHTFFGMFVYNYFTVTNGQQGDTVINNRYKAQIQAQKGLEFGLGEKGSRLEWVCTFNVIWDIT